MKTLFEDRFAGANHVLLAGCGGGYDVASAIPLQSWLASQGVRTTLANLSFADLPSSGAPRIGPAGWIVEPTCSDMGYFPERHIAEWLLSRGHEPRIIGLQKTGVKPLCETFDAIIAAEGIDAVVLVDGGTDSLAKGDEARLGTIEEDALSIVALSLAAGIPKSLACIGFGIDRFHGVCHHSFLENTAEMIRVRAFLGCLSLMAGQPWGDAFLDLVEFLNNRHPSTPSIVANSIASALRGEFGDYHATNRTRGSTLFINPLMSLYWCYDVVSVAAHMAFAEPLHETLTFDEVRSVIHREHARAKKRDWTSLPL